MGKKLIQNQDGVAAIVIVTAVIIITSLIVTGFSTNIRNEQRQALDQQLKVQARLAAESVINEKIAQYRANPTQFITDNNNYVECESPASPGPDGEYYTFGVGVSNEITNVCVQVNAAPSSLEYDELSNSDSTVVWLDPGSLSADKLVITWERKESEGGGGECLNTPYNTLPTNLGMAAPSGVTGLAIDMIRFDLVAAQPADGATFSRGALINNMFGGILYPQSGGTASVAYNPTDQAVIFGACSDTSEADLESIIDPAGTYDVEIPDSRKAYAVVNIPAAYKDHRFLLRLKGVYKGALVRVYGVSPASPSPELVPYRDVQIGIEATVQTTDIVQNVQARIPASTPPADLLPDYAIHAGSGGVCKILHSYPGGSTNECVLGNETPPAHP